MTKNTYTFGRVVSMIMVMGAILALYGCSDHDFDLEEHYPGNATKDEYTNFWIEEIGEIDPTHDWNMVTQVSAHVSLSEWEDIEGSQIKVFTNDPYKESSRLLACYDVTDREMDIKFDVLKSADKVFVMRQRGNGYYAMVISEITDGKCVANFAGQKEVNTRAIVGTRAGSYDYPTSVPSDAEKIEGTYSEYYELDYNHTPTTIWLDGATFNNKFYSNQPNLKIYVTGNVTINELGIGQNGVEIYVLNGATLKVSSAELTWESKYIVCPGGAIIFEDEAQFSGATIINGGYIKCGSFYMSNTKMTLEANSQLVVEGTAKFGYNAYVANLGIYSSATGEDWAVVKVGQIETEADQAQCATFVGNLIVDCTNMPEQEGRAEWNNYNYWFFNGAKQGEGGDDYEIPGGDNQPEYDPEVPEIPEPDPVSYIIACEDLGDTDDYDFNDIVLKVSHVAGRTTATVTPLAAGGTLATYWGFGALDTDPIGGELHTQFGDSEALTYGGSLCMLNTGKEYPNIVTNGLEGTPQTIEVDEDFTLANDPENDTNMGGFWIMVEQSTSSSDKTTAVAITAPTPYIQNVPSATKQTAPQMLLLPDGWSWPKERMPITLAYQNFVDWNSDATVQDWIDHMDSSVVY